MSAQCGGLVGHLQTKGNWKLGLAHAHWFCRKMGDSAANCLHYFPNAACPSQMQKLPLGLYLENTQQAAKTLEACFSESWVVLTSP